MSGRTSGPNGRQLLLDFPRTDGGQRAVIETEPYATALATLRRWRSWPGGQLALIGDAGAGKSRLLQLWAAEAGAGVVTGAALAAADITEIASLTVSALAIDDADGGGAGEGLLAALNLGRDRNVPILLTGHRQPALWFERPKDLHSRLSAMPVAEIGPPDEESLRLRLVEECEARFLRLPDDAARYLADRMERSWEAVARVGAALQHQGGRTFAPQAVRKVLISLGMAGD